MGNTFWTALALMFVFEGFFPAAAPNLFRRMLISMAQMDQASIRISGFVSMVLGVLLLYLVRH